MKPLLVLILLLCIHFSYSQHYSNTDSLKLSLKNVQADTLKVSTLAELSFNYALTKPDSGILYAQQAISLAKKIGNEKSEALAMLCYSWALWVYADYDKAADFALKSLQLFQQRKDYEMIASANNGHCCTTMMLKKSIKFSGKGWLCLHIRSVLSIAIFQLWQVDKN